VELDPSHHDCGGFDPTPAFPYHSDLGADPSAPQFNLGQGPNPMWWGMRWGMMRYQEWDLQRDGGPPAGCRRTLLAVLILVLIVVFIVKCLPV
jgi:hypothetical protein